MPRQPARLGAPLAFLAAATVVLAACGGGPTLPALTDPKEIITAGLNSTEAAKTVHAELTADGSITADLFGLATGSGGSTGTEISLAGTSASADVDMANGRAHATFAVPAMLNLNGDLIQVGETSYVKTSLTGPLYETYEATDELPVDPTNAAGIFDGLRDLLTTEGVNPVKGDDVDCAGTPCYAVTIDLGPEQLAALGAEEAIPAGLPIDLGSASLALTVRVEKNTYHLAGINAVLSFAEQGSVTADVAFSKWDQPVDVSPPPADQLKPAG
jgi:hypothetical protein